MGGNGKNLPAGVSRKDLGAWYTPPALCRFLAERVLAGLKPPRSRARLRVCDPMVGAGAFLEAARALTAGRAELYGVDIDPRALRQARRRLGPGVHLRQGDALISPVASLAPTVTSLAPTVREGLHAAYGNPSLTVGASGRSRSGVELFCWATAFPEVFVTDAGFDVVLTNPPWNNLRADDREFFSRHDPTFRTLSTKRARDQRRQTLLRSRTLRREYEDYLARFKLWNEVIRAGGLYRQQGGPSDGSAVYRIEHNLYKLAMERAWELTRPGGRIGLVVPAGFLGDLGATQLRKLYFDGAACLGLWSFDENAGIFDAAQGFVVVVFEKGGKPRQFRVCGGLEGWSTASATPRAAGLSVEILRRIAPSTYAVPDVNGAAELAILEKLHRHPPLGEWTANDPWRARPARDLHTRDDHDLLIEPSEGGEGDLLPALKGADIEAFRLRIPCKHFVEARHYEARGKDFHASRVAWRAIANVHLARRLQAALIPPRHALLNSINYFIPEQPEVVKFYLLGLLNSLVLEWRVRLMAKNNNINQFVIASLPVPRLSVQDERLRTIASLARRLTKTGQRAAGFRPAVSARLEARIALLYELSAAELSVILQRFPRVPQDEKERALRALTQLERASPLPPIAMRRRGRYSATS